MEVEIAPIARDEIGALPIAIMARVLEKIAGLASYPNVSGMKRLTGAWRGFTRLRTGDYRIVFRVEGNRVIVVRVQKRKDVYED